MELGINNKNSFQSSEKTVNKPKEEKTKIYISKTPDRAAQAAGVIAGTSGMVGGAILGGLVGLCKLPGELISSIAGQNYSKIITDSAQGFKAGIKNSYAIKELVFAINNINTPGVAEDLIKISGTLSERLHETFKNDAAATSVIDEVIDPFINSLSVKRNFRSYVSGGVKQTVQSPVGQTVLKILGLNKKTSKIIGDITGHIAEGISQSVINIQNFTPEQRKAWGKVCNCLAEELKGYPQIKNSKEIIKAIKDMGADLSWITEPLKNMQTAIVNGAHDLNKGLGKAPVKTIGKWSAIGAAVCGTASTLCWLGLKKSIMKKEQKKFDSLNG